MKCSFCANYLSELDRCKFCSFEYEERYSGDDWDILELDDDIEWSHKQILNRLHSKGIDCISADIWFDNDCAFLLGCFAYTDKVARALNLHNESVYGNLDNGLVILNLYKEKQLRLSKNHKCGECYWCVSKSGLTVCYRSNKLVELDDDSCEGFIEEK